MIEVRAESRPGLATRPNEDAYLCMNDLVIVADGATAPPSLGTGCIHSPRWYATTLVANAGLANVGSPDAPLTDILSEAIRRTTNAHASTCDVVHPGTPSSTVVALRAADTQAEWLVLGDATLAFEGPQGLQVVSDTRLSNSSKAERHAVLTGGNADGRRGDRIAALSNAQRSFRNVDGGFWIAAADPNAAYQALTGTEPLAPGSTWRAALLTDGAALAVDTYALTDWHGALDVLQSAGTTAFLDAVRKVESDDPDFSSYPRMKRSDDATVAYVSGTTL